MNNKYNNSTYKNNLITDMKLSTYYVDKVALLQEMEISINNVFIDIIIITTDGAHRLNVNIEGYHVDSIKGEILSNSLKDAILTELQYDADFNILK